MRVASSELIPRPELVDALIANPAKVVFVDGPSGAGKSVVLQQAVAAVRSERYVAETCEVMWSDPLLPLLLKSLSDVVARIVERQGAAVRIGQRLAGAVERMVESRGRELAEAAGREILNFLRSRLGPDAGKAIADAVAALQEESAESLGARLDRARPQVAREVIVDFFAEIAGVSDQSILVPIDRAERLDEAGLRLLADLAEVLPDGAQIWVAARDDSTAGQFLPATDASVVHVPPFDAAAVGQLLERRGLPPGEATQVLEHTDGTALDVQAYVGLLSAEAAPRVDDLTPALVVTRDTTWRMSRLSADARFLALRFAVLSDPLPETYLVRLADGDSHRLATAMSELHAEGLLTAYASGEWIHERRRAAMLEAASEPERVSAVADTATAVWEYLQGGGEPRWLVALAELAASATEFAPDDRALQSVLRVDATGLAVVAGLIELCEPGREATEAQALLNYVRSAWPTDHDELESLERASEAGLVAVESDEYAAVAVLRLSGLAKAVAIGRIARRFGQMPIPAIASTAFREVILPRIEPYRDGQYGVGRPSLRTLSYAGLGREEDVWTRPPASERRDAGPGLIVRAGFAGRPLYGSFRFTDEVERDRALDAVGGLDTEFLDSRVSVSGVLAYPMGVVPAERFLRAASRVLGRKIRPKVDRVSEEVDEPFSFEELADLRVRTYRVLRDLAGAAMRGAMELDRPLSLHWSAVEGRALVVDVEGGREITCEHRELSREAWKPGPYQSFHLARELGLRADETITHVAQEWYAAEAYAPTSYDPVLAEIGRRRAAAIAYNRAQPPLVVWFDESLPGHIRTSFFREMVDARALAAALPLLRRESWEVPPTAKYVVLTRETYDPHWVAGARSTLAWAEAASPSGEDEIHVVYREDGSQPTADTWALFSDEKQAARSFPGLKPDAIVRMGSSVQMTGVAALLAHSEADLDLRHADAE